LVPIELGLRGQDSNLRPID